MTPIVRSGCQSGLPRLADQILAAVPRLGSVPLCATRDRGEVVLHPNTNTGPAGRRPSELGPWPYPGFPNETSRRPFSAASGGWTLHQLRHSAITHLAEADVGLALLMSKSRHTSLRSLQRYARPGPEAVAKLTAEHDPERRRR